MKTFMYEGEPTIPPGMTVREYQRIRAQQQTTAGRARILAPVIAAIKKRLV